MTSYSISGKSVDVVANDNGKVMWCSDWAKLMVAVANGDPRFESRHYGPNTYGHVDVFVR